MCLCVRERCSNIITFIFIDYNSVTTPTVPVTNVTMEASGAVLGVLFALVLVIVISPFATVYVLWKDGCCKRREETVEEEGMYLIHTPHYLFHCPRPLVRS